MKYLAIGFNAELCMSWSIEIEYNSLEEVKELKQEIIDRLARHNDNGIPDDVLIIANGIKNNGPIVQFHW